jgi:hypothetical protein
VRCIARHLFTLFSAISLFLLFIVLVVWRRSRWLVDELDIEHFEHGNRHLRELSVLSGLGSLGLSRTHITRADDRPMAVAPALRGGTSPPAPALLRRRDLRVERCSPPRSLP